MASFVLAAYPSPGACSGVCHNAHDPSIIRRDDGTYFRFSTGGKIAIHSAPAIIGPWTYKGPAIRAGSRINLAGRDDLWAPDQLQLPILRHRPRLLPDLLSWTDHGATGISSDRSKPYNAIDANLFQYAGDSGSPTMLMSFGSFWGDLYQVPMASAGKSVGAAARQIVYQPAGEHAVEAAYLFANAGIYYLFFSAGKCCALDKNRPAAGQEYRVMVCRASSPAGPFTDKSGRSCRSGGGTVVLPSHGNVYAPGGQGVFRDPTLGPVLYYHYVDRRVGYGDGQKVFGWNRLDFTSGWPVAV
ncbi:hypothetical protein LTS18_006297 [Coniosporium uncinatum]|uniref:Uncharacterized protein n=1 Tax=Coniosporium uncinatum TaxID=93489 RepID=A0ACC3DQV4_9PEZI|nr:hypothetical protein LTS18_006297 [Coniosporium uncinatum]